jgi:hypothetical protein
VEKEKEEFQDLELRHSINDLKVSGSSPKEALISHSSWQRSLKTTPRAFILQVANLPCKFISIAVYLLLKSESINWDEMGL